MIYRVCLSLNQLDWSKVLPVTDDFVVIASDWSAGFQIYKDALASLPKEKVRTLKKSGFFFNPASLPKPSRNQSRKLNSIRKKTSAEQADFWILQLDGLFYETECEAKWMGLGEVQVVNKLASLNELGAEALMIFVEGKACTPEWSGPHATLQFSEQSQRSTVLREAVRGIEITCSSSLDTETRLWRAFDRAIQTELAGKGEYRNVRIKQSWIQKQLGQGKVFEIEWIWKEFTFGAIYLNV